MYNLGQIGKMMRCFSPIGNIDGIDLCVAGIEVHPHLSLVSHLGQSNTPKSVLYVKKSAVGQQIILIKSVTNQKKKFSDRYPKYKARPSYKQDLQCWITEYESIEDKRVA